MASIIDIATWAGATERMFVHAGDRKAVRLRREYAYSVDELWSTWTEPDRLRRWIGEVRGDLREGATVQLCMSPPDADIATLTIVACDAPRRLVVKWEWPDEPDSIVDLTINPLADGRSELILEHVALIDATAAGYGSGWEDFLIRLDAWLNGDDPAQLTWAEVEPTIQPMWNTEVALERSSDRWPTIVPGESGSDVRAVRVVAASVDEVWNTLTDPDQLSSWFGAVDGELTPGSTFTVTFDNGSATGTIRECVAEKGFVVSWAWAHENADTLVAVNLEAAASGTRIVIEQRGVVGPARGYAAGWAAHLAALGRHIAGCARSDRLWQADWEVARAMMTTP